MSGPMVVDPALCRMLAAELGAHDGGLTPRSRQFAAVIAQLTAAAEMGEQRGVHGRPDGCQCHLETGDSLCPVHPPPPEELAYAASIGAPYRLDNAEPAERPAPTAPAAVEMREVVQAAAIEELTRIAGRQMRATMTIHVDSILRIASDVAANVAARLTPKSKP